MRKRYNRRNQVFGRSRPDNYAREISLTRLIPRVNPSRRARGAYRRYVAANYGGRYHPGKPRQTEREGEGVEGGKGASRLDTDDASNSSNHKLRLPIPAISEARARQGVDSTPITRFPTPRLPTSTLVYHPGRTFLPTRYLTTFSYPFRTVLPAHLSPDSPARSNRGA